MTNIVDANVDLGKSADHANGIDTSECEELGDLANQFAHRVEFFVRRIGNRFGLAEAWRDDLTSAGYWGLLKAIQNRRADAHERELSAYVSRRIEGSIFDEARRLLSRHAHQVEWGSYDLEDWAIAGGRSISENLGNEGLDPEERADRSSRWRRVEESLAVLDDDERQLLIAYAEGSSLSELARAGGSTAGRLQTRLNRTVRQVRGRSPELRRILRLEL